MPRLTDVLCSRSKLDKFTNYKPKKIHKQLLPAILKNTVSSGGENRKVHGCMQEMSFMLTCFKKTDFSQTQCSKEVDAFLKCQTEFQKVKAVKEEMKTRGLVGMAAGRVPSKQLNELLSRYPRPLPLVRPEKVGVSKRRKG